MYKYAPWAIDVLDRLIASSSKSLPILDIQFGGACNLNCIYCDTPKYDSPCLLDLDSIERILNTGKFQWVYSCGLGEMTANGNNEAFRQVLAMCKKNGTKVSIYSNMINLDDELLNYIDNGTLHVLFKLDSFRPPVMKYLYGKPDKHKIMLNNYQKLKEVVHVENGATNLGASIVLSNSNYDEICEIFDFLLQNDMYGALMDLEEAGKCTGNIFDELRVGENQQLALRQRIEKQYGIDCTIPICPASIFAIHITNTNRVIVDEKTGLSCGWFRLENPKMIEIGNIIDTQIEVITAKIIAYRKAKRENVIAEEKLLQQNPFGGCGGDAKKLLQQYISIAVRY